MESKPQVGLSQIVPIVATAVDAETGATEITDKFKVTVVHACADIEVRGAMPIGTDYWRQMLRQMGDGFVAVSGAILGHAQTEIMLDGEPHFALCPPAELGGWFIPVRCVDLTA
jgi:hypothetical protein